jgi:predicted lipid-binding transport protein (Tim44 family)
MKSVVRLLVFAMVLGMASLSADAARRFGGGGNLGKQRPAPAMKEAAPAPPAAAPAGTAAKPAQATPATAAAPAAKPSFMQRWGGLLAGLGIGALLGSMFGASMGPMVGMLLMVLLVAGIGFMLFRLFASKARPSPALDTPGVAADIPGARPQFSGIGSALPGGSNQEVEAPPAQSFERPVNPIPGFETEPFVRVAKTSFIRLQAANDAKDLDDIRDFTTPEVFAEISMQIRERGDEPQKTEVVMVDARVIETVVEDDYAIASVRFTGLIRENGAANPEPFDETWHVRKNLRERNGSWLISGIQQVQEAA